MLPATQSMPNFGKNAQFPQVRTWKGLAGGIYTLIETRPQWNHLFSILKTKTHLACDLETDGLNSMINSIVGLSFSFGAEHSFYVPVNHKKLVQVGQTEPPRSKPIWDEERCDEKHLFLDDIFDDLKALFFNPKLTTIWHNFKFDGHFLNRLGILPKGIVHDTLLMHNLLNETESGKLKKLASEYIDKGADDWEKELQTFRQTFARKHKLKKDDIHYGLVPIDLMTRYAASDAHYTWILFKKFLSEIADDKHLRHLYVNVEIPLLHVLIEMEYYGACVNRTYFKGLMGPMDKKIQKAEIKIKEIFKNPQINLNSVQQLVAALLKSGVKLSKKTKKKTNFSLDHNVLERLALKYPVCKDILDYRDLTKKKSTYIDSIYDKSSIDGNLHCEYNQNVSTGRMCLEENTHILVIQKEGAHYRTSNKEGVPIKDVKPGDLVYCYTPEKKITVREVIWSGSRGYKDAVKVSYYGYGKRNIKSIICTPDHSFRTHKEYWIQAKDLLKKHKLISLEPNDLKPGIHKMVSVESCGKANVWDISVDGIPNFFANGVCVHNSSKNPNLQNIPGRDTIIRKGFVPPLLNYCDKCGYREYLPAKGGIPSFKNQCICGHDLKIDDNYFILLCDFCLVGNTKLITIDGIKTLEEVVQTQVPVLSCDPKKVKGPPAYGRKLLEFKEVTRSALIGYCDVYKIELEDGSSVECTLDHKWMTYEGELRETRNLSVGDRLAHVKESYAGPNKYPMWYVKSNRQYHYKHTLSAEFEFGKTPKGHQVDHIDGNVNDWRRKNLRILTEKENKGQGASHWWNKVSEEKQKEKINSLIYGIKNNRRSYAGEGNPNYGKFKGEIKECPYCGEEFYAPPSANKIFCSKDCYNSHRNVKKTNNHRIVSITYAGKQPVYQITVEDFHTYVLENGLISGNSQLEVRLTAHASQDPILLKVYQEGIEDAHLRATCEIFDYDYTEAEAILADDKHPQYVSLKNQRKIGKQTNFLIIYGGGPSTLSLKISTPEYIYPDEECQLYIDKYFSKYRGIKRWINQVRYQLRKNHYVQNEFGRYRRFPELNRFLEGRALVSKENKWAVERCLRQGVNFLIQGLAADLFKVAMRRVADILRGTKSRLVMPIHDEIVMYMHRKDIYLLPDIKQQMEDFDFSVPMIADISYSNTNWAEKKELRIQ